MSHGRIIFTMDAPCEVVFDAFHHHELRQRWDSLVKHPILENGDEWPSVGAVTFNPGTGWTRFLSMRTRFISFDRPTIAAATMVGITFPFQTWSASLKHLPLPDEQSNLIYVYNIKASWYLRGWAGWVVHAVFRHETHRRFLRMQKYLAIYASEIKVWQAARRN
jgi:hypothetical protein